MLLTRNKHHVSVLDRNRTLETSRSRVFERGLGNTSLGLVRCLFDYESVDPISLLDVATLMADAMQDVDEPGE